MSDEAFASAIGRLKPTGQGDLEARATLNARLAEALVSVEDASSHEPSALQSAALRFVMRWDDRLMARLAEATLEYCLRFSEDVGLPVDPALSSTNIVDSLHINVIIIPVQVREQPVVRIEFDCDWEPEHGLEWVVQAPDSVLYVGPFRMTSDWLDDTESGYTYVLE